MSAINWYPGHMHTSMKEFVKTLARVDVVLEILDARAPYASSNPKIDEACKSRGRVLVKVLGKTDLADPSVTKKWIEHYQKGEKSKSFLVSDRRQNYAKLIRSFLGDGSSVKQSSDKIINLMIVGIPNVGKSTFFNTLAQRKLAPVANIPAYTRRQQYTSLQKQNMQLVDTPGLLWPKINEERVGYLLAANKNIGHNAYCEEDVGYFVMDRLINDYPETILKRYGIEIGMRDKIELLESIAIKKNFFCKGGNPALRKAATALLNDYRSGRLGRISLERPFDL